MNTPKPQYCQQDWLRMNEVPGGRVCSSCEKKIIDFTGKSWKEISSLQAENNHSLCGLYTQKQLDHWGHQAPHLGFNPKAVAVVASLLLSVTPSFATFSPTPLIEAHCPDTLIVEQPVEPADSPLRLCTIRGTVTDEETGEPIPFVNVHLITRQTGAIMDFDGKYEVTISLDDSTSTANDELEFSSIGYTTKRIVGLPMGRDEIVVDTTFSSEDIDIIAFHVTPVSRTKRIWYRLTKPFRRKR